MKKGSYVQYWSERDYEAAKVIADALKIELLKTDTFPADRRFVTGVIVGAQEANPVFADTIWQEHYIRKEGDNIVVLHTNSGRKERYEKKVAQARYRDWVLDKLPSEWQVERGPVPKDWPFRPVTESDADHIFIQHKSNFPYQGKAGYDLWWVAGWHYADTLASARWIAKNGLKVAYISKSDAPEYWRGLGEDKRLEELKQLFITALHTGPSAAWAMFKPLSFDQKMELLGYALAGAVPETTVDAFVMFIAEELVKEHPEFEVLLSQPRGSLTLLGVLSLIGSIIGFGSLINWARKEIPEPAGMAVWALIEAEKWDEAWEACNLYEDAINKANGFVGQTFSWWNPFVKKYFDANMKAQRDQLAGYRSIIEPHIFKETELRLDSEPQGARIWIDGEDTGRYTPATLHPSPGMHEFKLTKKGYKPLVKLHEVRERHIDVQKWTLEPEAPPEVPIIPPKPEQPPEKPPEVPPEVPPEKPPEVPPPEKEVVIPLEKAKPKYNAWKVTIRAVDKDTGEELHAAILINDVFMDKYTPWWFYFYPEATYNIKLRKKGYYQGELDYTTPPLPEE